MGKYTHIDCFSGPGGICTGLHAAGFETVIAIEYIQSCCETYSKNHPQVHVINDDIRSVTYEDIAPSQIMAWIWSHLGCLVKHFLQQGINPGRFMMTGNFYFGRA